MRERREPKFNKSYRRALLIDAAGGGLCERHGEYIGHGKYGLKDCPRCDIEAHFIMGKSDKDGQNISQLVGIEL